MGQFGWQSVLRYVSLLLLAGVIFQPFSSLATTHDTQFSVDQQKLIEGIIQNYILENPKIILQSIREMEAREQHAKEQRVQQTLSDRSKDLIADPNSYVGGNPDGDITLVEFFDYQCGYCKQVHPTVSKLLKEDGNIRFVYKEFPILGPASVYAARAAIASRPQNKYFEFHNALMELKGPLSQQRVLKVAETVGIDAIRLAKDIEATQSDSDGVMELNYDLAKDLNINGTPAFIVGNTVIRGAADLVSLKEAIAAGRAEKAAQGG